MCWQANSHFKNEIHNTNISHVSKTSQMSTIEYCGVTELLGILLQTKQNKNPLKLKHPTFSHSFWIFGELGALYHVIKSLLFDEF